MQLTDGRYKACWAFGVKWKVKMTEEDTNELIRYETVASPGLITYSESISLRDLMRVRRNFAK